MSASHNRQPTRFVYARGGGIGSGIQRMIHSALDAVPDTVLSPERKKRIKRCRGCTKRVRQLDKATAFLRSGRR